MFFEKGQNALEGMCSADPALASAIFAQEAKRPLRNAGAQAGARGVAQDLYPGISEYLDSLQSKKSVLELLKGS